MQKSAFANLHGAVSFFYFAAVVLVTVLVLHPAVLAVSLLFAGAYLAVLEGARGLWRRLRWLLPLIPLTAAFNALVSHRGVTALFMLKNGNAVTLESLVYGLMAGGMLAAAVLWLACFHAVFTSDKLMALTGRRLPTLSLLTSMSLRFVPRVRRQVRVIAETRRALCPEAGRLDRLRGGVQTLSSVVSWMLERSVVTADVMRARGHGLPGATVYRRERFAAREWSFLALALPLAAAVAALLIAGYGGAEYYPALRFAASGPGNAALLAAWALLCALPLLTDGREAIAWRRSQRNI